MTIEKERLMQRTDNFQVMRYLMFFLLVGWCACTVATAGEAKPFGGTLSPMKKAPVLDGKLEDGEWDNAIRTVNFQSIVGTPMMDAREGSTMIGFYGDRLYIQVTSELPPRPSEGPYSTVTAHDAEGIWDFNAIEVWFDPNRDRRESSDGDQAFYQMFINTLGTTEDMRFVPGNTPDKTWNPAIESAHGLDTVKKIWIAEFSIPLKDLGMDSAKLIGSSMGILISRNYKAPWAQMTAFPHKDAFVAWRNYPRFFFTKNDPVVAIESLGEKLFIAEPDIQVKIQNPGPARTAKLKLHITSSDMPDLKDEKEIALPANGESAYRYVVPKDRLHIKDIDHKFTLSVESADEKETWFNYAAGWSHDPLVSAGWSMVRRSVDKKWDVRTEAQPENSLGVTVAPSNKQVKVAIDASMMVIDPVADAALISDSAAITITGPGGKELAKETLVWDRSKKEMGTKKAFTLPEFPEGEYVITAVLNKQPEQKITKTYVRKVFPFEGNSIGITDTIYAPFEPVKVQGDKVSVVCREYTGGSLGLWSSVKSLGKEILAAPIVLKADGERVLAGKPTLKSSNPQGVTFESTADDAAVVVKSTCTTELDGCMKVTLNLLPGTEKKELKSLVLDIPVKDSLAPLWHCATTSLRQNPVGDVPQGDGIVWDSTKFPDGDWIGNFKTYLWLGGVERGLCWFASNDKGWVLNYNDKKEFSPCLQLIRKDGVLTLRVNLVQKPITFSEPRTITFGLMASPGKPMPQDFRAVTVAGGLGKGYENNPTIGFMGSQYWGSDEVFNAAYPRNGDLTILEATRRIPGTPGGDMAIKDAKKYFDDWVERNFKPGLPMGEKAEEQIVSLARLCVFPWSGSGGPGYNTAYWDEYMQDSRIHPEVQTFWGEWAQNGMVRSRQDFRAYWGAEFVKRDFGLYFDNAFPRKTRDIETSDAYEIPGFGIQPASLIWEQRDYHRRIWNIHREFGGEFKNKPIEMIHMTNSNIIPYLTWSDSILDLEWFYGPEPQQSKYSAGMLQAQSSGRQTGNYPCVLARIQDVKNQEQNRMAVRSRFGVMMVHEIKAEGQSATMNRLVYDFGYSKPECEVHNYWDEDYPVVSNNPANKSILLKNGKELLLVVCTWNRNPQDATFTFNTDALGVAPTTASDVEDQVAEQEAKIAMMNTDIESTTKAVATFTTHLAAGKPDAQKKLDKAQATLLRLQKELPQEVALIPLIKSAVKPITYDAAKKTLQVPLEGYGVRVIKLK